VAFLHPDKQVVVMDGEGRFPKVWKAEWPFVENIDYYPLRTWEEIRECYDLVSKKLKPGDWLFMEMVDKFWEQAQNAYIIKKFGMTLDEYLTNLKAEQGKKGDPDSMNMWQVVKKEHNFGLMDPATSFLDANVVLTAPAHPIMIGMDGKELVDLFNAVGFRPEGEKRNFYRVNTCILFEIDIKGGNPKRTWTTLKDKGRKRAWREPFDGATRAWWETYVEFTTGGPG
jgi:hypothetical protein